jgi:YggT family protein
MTTAQNPLLILVCLALTVFFWVLLIRVILSWAELLGFRRPYAGPLATAIGLLYTITEPVLRPLRAMIPPVRMGAVGLDLSVIIAFVILYVLQLALC